MANFAYLRVSTDKQEVDNQRFGILEYANNRGITDLIFVEDSISSSVSWDERGCGKLIKETAKKGDVIIFAEVSRLARSTLETLQAVKIIDEVGVDVHVAKEHMQFDGSMNSTIMATMFGLAAEIEKRFIQLRTKEALAHKKHLLETQGYFINKKGVKCFALGRPKGKNEKVKLDDHRTEILEWLDKGLSKRAIATLLDCSKSTLYDWFKRRDIAFKN
jgi:DNA invertase Pin-like site-specific DNA recombinase